MARNLVVCLDGTDNEFGVNNTNVVRLFQSLEADVSKQIGYYDPGVGTLWEPGTWSKASQKTQMILGLAFGLGVTSNVSEAYEFIMRVYEPEDRLFLFGFSRGAFEARALAGLIHRCGLLRPELASLVPYAVRLFQTKGNDQVVSDFLVTFSRTVEIELLGLWDTVTSVGNVWSPVYWPNVTFNPGVRRVCHAIALDERRAFFRPNRWGRSAERQTVSELWFAGVHSDVGGGYAVTDGRLWAITLAWMLENAHAAGLHVDAARANEKLAAGRVAGGTEDCDSTLHDSLTSAWRPLELVPKPHSERQADGSYGPKRLLIPALSSGLSGRPRTIFRGEKVHRSAVQRFVDLKEDYRPTTLVQAGLTDSIGEAFLRTDQEAWTVP